MLGTEPSWLQSQQETSWTTCLSCKPFKGRTYKLLANWLQLVLFGFHELCNTNMCAVLCLVSILGSFMVIQQWEPRREPSSRSASSWRFAEQNERPRASRSGQAQQVLKHL